jgi:FkbM family methyltransferase
MKIKSQLSLVLWSIKRSIILDFKLLKRGRHLTLASKIAFILKKYITIIKHLFIPYKLGDSSISLFGRSVYYNSPFASVAGFEAVLTEHLHWFSQLDMPEDPFIIDVGANVGYVSMGLKQFFPKSEIVCFEPISLTFQALSKNMAGFENVRLYNYAIGDSNNDLEFFYDEKNTVLAGIGSTSGKSTEIVKQIRLDDILKYNKLLKHVDMLKIDVEGSELEALKGATETLAQTRYLHIEFNSNNYSFSELIECIKQTKRKYQLLFVRNFDNDTDNMFTVGDFLIEFYP